MVFTEEQRAALHRALDDNFRRIEMPPWRVRPERNAEIVRLRREGVGLGEIAARYGITRQRVHQIWRRVRAGEQLVGGGGRKEASRW